MTPNAFSFNGIKIMIYYEDHLPIHIHAKYGEFETVYELTLENGKLVNVTEREANNSTMLPEAQNKRVRKFLKKHYKKVVEKWTDIVIYQKPIKLTRISGI